MRGVGQDCVERIGELPDPVTDQRVQSGRRPQGSLTVSGRSRLTPSAAIAYRTEGSYTFTVVILTVV